jgi:hypothetical protein
MWLAEDYNELRLFVLEVLSRLRCLFIFYSYLSPDYRIHTASKGGLAYYQMGSRDRSAGAWESLSWI